MAKELIIFPRILEVICKVNIVKSIHYEIDKEECFQFIRLFI